jgi:general secretion pathway protein M
MTLKLPPKIVCALVWFLLVMVPLLFLAGILLPWTSQIAELNERIATGEDQLARYRRLLQTLPGLQAELEQVRNNDAFKAFYFSAPTPALAGAQLQSQVQAIVTTAKGSLVSTQLLPEEKSENPPRVRVRTQIQGSTETLLDVLHQIEQARPFLFVEQLSIRSSARPDLPDGPRRMPRSPTGELTVRLDIFGFALGGGT